MTMKKYLTELRDCLEKIIQNIDALEGCEEPHFFTPDQTIQGTVYQCTKCGGTVEPNEARWYNDGFHRGFEWAEGAYQSILSREPPPTPEQVIEILAEWRADVPK